MKLIIFLKSNYLLEDLGAKYFYKLGEFSSTVSGSCEMRSFTLLLVA